MREPLLERLNGYVSIWRAQLHRRAERRGTSSRTLWLLYLLTRFRAEANGLAL